MRDVGKQRQPGKTDMSEDAGNPALRRTEEFRTFIFLTVVMAPVLAVMVVGGYGFIVWVYQMIAGPPGAVLH